MFYTMVILAFVATALGLSCYVIQKSARRSARNLASLALVLTPLVTVLLTIPRG